MSNPGRKGGDKETRSTAPALYTLIVARAYIAFIFAVSVVTLAQDPKPAREKPATRGPVIEQEPAEEDPALKPTEYSFNPLEASRNITTGNFYFKKGNHRAAMRRYLEATKWDPMSGEAYLKLGESYEKLHDFTNAREAYTKYISLGPDPKNAEAVTKRLEKFPKPKAETAAPSADVGNAKIGSAKIKK